MTGEIVPPPRLFRHCPRCAAPRPVPSVGAVPVECEACGLVYFLNPAVAAAALVSDPRGRLLFFRRLREPKLGMLAAPGGFLDPGETVEVGVRREAREEVGLELANVRYLTSCPNVYEYKGVAYPVLDLVFAADAVDPESATSSAEAGELVWLAPEEIDPAALAFESLRRGVAALAGGGP